jgi:hypothetical protein
MKACWCRRGKAKSTIYPGKRQCGTPINRKHGAVSVGVGC